MSEKCMIDVVSSIEATTPDTLILKSWTASTFKNQVFPQKQLFTTLKAGA
jgi:hypothetical protein